MSVVYPETGKYVQGSAGSSGQSLFYILFVGLLPNPMLTVSRHLYFYLTYTVTANFIQ